MPLLGATRLSRKTDESTSIERQREQVTLSAQVRGDTLVHICEDTDISGGVSPFLRESLGPWLTDPDKIAQWDGLVVAKLDRLTRSLTDFDELVSWCDRHGKTLISVSESLDLSTSTGRMFANLLAMFAQFERERIAERRREAAVKMRDNGWWQGGRPPYGMRPVKVNDHWELEIDPETYARSEQIAYEIVAGHSVTSIAKRLTATEVPTPGGAAAWNQNTIRRMFANPKCPLEADLRLRVLEALDKTKTPWTRRGDAALLLNIAYCYQCKKPLYSKRYTSKGHLYEYYDCSARCGARRISMRDLEAEIDKAVAKHGSEPWREKHIEAGVSYKAEIGIIERQIRALDLDDEAQRAVLMAERARLIDLDKKTSKTQTETWVETGETIAEHWQQMNPLERRAWLLSQDSRLFAGCHQDRAVYGAIELNVYGIKSLDTFGTLPGPSLLGRAKWKGLDKLVDADAAAEA
jgi:DNA invertase Pin-like site-specific DNA recombinase